MSHFYSNEVYIMEIRYSGQDAKGLVSKMILKETLSCLVREGKD